MSKRQREKIRMAAIEHQPVDETLAPIAKRMRALGLTKEAIGRALGMSSVAVEKLLGEGKP